MASAWNTGDTMEALALHSLEELPWALELCECMHLRFSLPLLSLFCKTNIFHSLMILAFSKGRHKNQE